ncbi:MAG: ATP synthase F0 subunit B [Acidobacteria bacterium]|nr:ATP synthase F0 subunit B [Acidobacteriota bacterium]MCA1642693.1 ATP synthase F0 subunit B [Acidobacteriota bacterium]
MFFALAENTIQLVPDGTLFLHIFLIILMVFILNLTLFRPINQILEERERQTHGRASDAQKIFKQIESDLGMYEQSLRGARTEGYGLLERQRMEALQERQSMLRSLRDELELSIEEQKNSIYAQAEQARLTLKEDTHRVADEIRQQILSRPFK